MSQILNRYENMNFPKYKFREYPKHIDVNGTAVNVRSEEEEATILKASKSDQSQMMSAIKEQEKKEQKSRAEANDKDALLAKAGELGLVLDKRMSVENIKNEITKAEAALDIVKL